MSHIILFSYFLQLSVGVAGIVAMGVLHSRIRSVVTGAFLVAMASLLLILFINLVSYYANSVLGIGSVLGLGPAGTVARYGVVLALAILVRLAVMRALLSFPRLPRVVVIGVTLLILCYQLGHTVVGLFVPPETMEALYLPSIGVGSLYLLVIGLLMLRAVRDEEEGTVSVLLYRVGVFTVAFAPLSLVAYALKQRFPEVAALQLSYDFLYFMVWSALTISVFLRYLSKPTALLEQGRISPGFVRSYKITPREAEVVRLISMGLSNKEIADKMCVSFTTARTHIYNIFQKTHAKTRVELLRIVTGFRE